MSYCRWSSDFWQCDVYVYEDASGGWTTHVAGRRRKHTVPDDIQAMPCSTGEEYVAQHMKVMEWLNQFDDDDDENWLELPEIYAGESFNDPTPGECADRLETIRAVGFNVPQYAIDALREEAIPQQQSTT